MLAGAGVVLLYSGVVLLYGVLLYGCPSIIRLFIPALLAPADPLGQARARASADPGFGPGVAGVVPM